MNNFREKQKRHNNWLQAGKDFAKVCSKNKLAYLDDKLSTSEIKSMFPEASPQCNCTDDGKRYLGIIPKVIKGGRYSLRTKCYLWTLLGTKNLHWDTIGRERVILVFANYFREQLQTHALKNKPTGETPLG